MFSRQVRYENWAFGEPNNYQGVELCVELTGDSSMLWNDRHCDYLHAWICQIKKGTTTSLFKLGQKPPFTTHLKKLIFL